MPLMDPLPRSVVALPGTAVSSPEGACFAALAVAAADEAAGQTVMHVHVPVISWRKNDSADPRGGVRWVIPRKSLLLVVVL